ncbi:hypothetical protein KSF78_0008788 [Schistosoma japonicum]|nr:hypothetical protein KSF78_0008788 [Schistosoma japonicum]
MQNTALYSISLLLLFLQASIQTHNTLGWKLQGMEQAITEVEVFMNEAIEEFMAAFILLQNFINLKCRHQVEKNKLYNRFVDYEIFRHVVTQRVNNALSVHLQKAHINKIYSVFHCVNVMHVLNSDFVICFLRHVNERNEDHKLVSVNPMPCLAKEASITVQLRYLLREIYSRIFKYNNFLGTHNIISWAINDIKTQIGKRE